ncbi:MAG TPA: hypothetical protein VMV08_05325, partial [Gaiellaceae bacterium]|nr:hypothetical protein [Gaiellaceae bacterium]
WMRRDAHGFSPFGPPNIADIRAGLDANGKIVAYDYTSLIGNSSNNPVDASVQVGLTVPADPKSGSSTRGAPGAAPRHHLEQSAERRSQSRDLQHR